MQNSKLTFQYYFNDIVLLSSNLHYLWWEVFHILIHRSVLFFVVWLFFTSCFQFFFLIALVNLIVISFAIIFIKFLLFGYILFYMFFKISSLLIIILVIQICIYLFHGTTGLQHFQYLFCLFSVYNLIFNNIWYCILCVTAQDLYALWTIPDYPNNSNSNW